MCDVWAAEFGAQAREFRTRAPPPLIPEQPSQGAAKALLADDPSAEWLDRLPNVVVPLRFCVAGPLAGSVPPMATRSTTSPRPQRKGVLSPPPRRGHPTA
jgi:hypothetical protein